MKKLHTFTEAQRRLNISPIDLMLNIKLGRLYAYRQATSGRLVPLGNGRFATCLVDIDSGTPLPYPEILDTLEDN